MSPGAEVTEVSGRNVRAGREPRFQCQFLGPAHASSPSSTPLPPRQVALGSGGGTEFFGGPWRLGAASFGRLGGKRGRGADWAVQRGGGL